MKAGCGMTTLLLLALIACGLALCSWAVVA
jgi:hypothetical protein